MCEKLYVLFFLVTIPFFGMSQTDQLTNLEKKADSLFQTYPERFAENKFTYPEVLNIFFAKQINSYLASSGDLSLSRGFAVLDYSDNRLFIGGTFTNREKKAEKLAWIIQPGIKSNIKNNFSSFFSNDNIRNDIGVGLKFTVIGNGTLSYFNKDPNEQTSKLAAYRWNLAHKLSAEYLTAYENYKAGIESFKKSDTTELIISASEALLKEFILKNIEEYESNLFEQEADYVLEKEVYAWARTSWLSLDMYAPITKSEYNVSSSISDPSISKQTYRPWTIKLIYTNLFANPKWGDVYISLSGGALANNVIKTEEMEVFEFSQSYNQGGVDTVLLAQLEENEVYVGKYREFVSYSGGVELAYFFPGRFNWVGISASVEKIFGDFEATNWKLGLPLSLTNEKGEPKINFELQWREQYKRHQIGISVGVPFGSLIH